MKPTTPFATNGQTIGLLGGSFDPAHAGHIHISEYALKYFHLDQLWWLVSPSNPLKEKPPRPIQERVHYAKSLISNPKIKITTIEQDLGSNYTAHTIQKLQFYFPKLHFVWLMGADNLMQFDKWKDWKTIVHNIPIGVLARPDDQHAPLTSKMARIYKNSRLSSQLSRTLGNKKAPIWCYRNIPLCHLSSTQIRANQIKNT